MELFLYGLCALFRTYISDYLDHKPHFNRGEVEQIIVKGKHEPIVTEEEYYKVQEMLRSRQIRK